MSRKNRRALHQERAANSTSASHDAPPADSASHQPATTAEPGKQKQGSIFKVAMLLWGAPIVLIVVMTVLREVLELW